MLCVQQTFFTALITAVFIPLMTGCAAGIPPQDISNQHIQKNDVRQVDSIPPIVDYTIPSSDHSKSDRKDSKTYSVLVKDLPIRDLLFALGRDAKINVDVSPKLEGRVTMNAIDQTLPELLVRMEKQVDVHFEMRQGTLIALPDTPYLVNYRVDYVNTARTAKGTISATSQIGSGGGVGGATNAGPSSVSIEDVSVNEFWKTLEKNIVDLLHETDKVIPTSPQGLQAVNQGGDLSQSDGGGAIGEDGASAPPRRLMPKEKQAVLKGAQAAVKDVVSGSLSTIGLLPSTVSRSFNYREAASVIVNRETGIVTVRATARQQDKVREFIDEVMRSAKRQVLIEATIAEVTLSNNYQQGIDWSRLRENGRGFGITQLPSLGTAANSQIPFQFTWRDNSAFSHKAVINLLEQFGNVKVLSSPKLSVLNNQTALLKVVENVVYFTASSDTVVNNNQSVTNVTTTPQSVAVGLVMSVTAQISNQSDVTLNIRPSISSVTTYQTDPNPNLQIASRIPQVSTREMESVLRVPSGNMVVLGGLIEDKVDFSNARVPILGRLPIIGELFNYRNNSVTKSELVVFLRPIVIQDASLEGDYRSFRKQLPGRAFFEEVDKETRYDNLVK